ncbi:molybdopterin-dependent oxidoreductase [Salipiger sp. P9]|uniref:xanthine dehydrogenase family protein molybdopterin-binding subunit n=1 Tax=Salipiger pentaromativorans TaxID=2943193 RepID=UPI0021581173|nr:molybdopterin cofactor-binding domain-containing protein [Salipiger pentaromativorans]MCR8550641.1 molybdopterin-dependent oxidoreductase [Salipiger pentaromativorans]
MSVKTSRRGFLAGAAASGLVIGVDARGALAFGVQAKTRDFTPFVRIDTTGRVTVLVKHLEMGQGPATGLPTLVAEELGSDLSGIRVEFAPADNEHYANTLFGVQLTGGSTALSNSFLQYRKAGAAARAVLLQAAAQDWAVPVAELTLENGTISGHGRSEGMGAFVETASAMVLPEDPPLKDPAQFRLIGNPDLRRTDTPAKIDGSAQYGMDVHLPNQMVAVILRPPRKGAVLTGFDAAAAAAVPGFIEAKEGVGGVVVFAEHTWAAFQAREAIAAEWDLSGAEARSQADLRAELSAMVSAAPAYEARADRPMTEIAAAVAGAPRQVEAEFFFPNLAHAPMEPVNCTIEPTADGGVILHDGCQFQTLVQAMVAGALGLEPGKVRINTMFAGGSFGRRSNTDADYPVEAAQAFALTDRSRPVKLVFSREDDVRGGYYRPAVAHKVRIGLDESGAIAGWDHRVAGESIIKGTPFEGGMVQEGGVDPTSVEGTRDTPYRIGGMFVGLTDSAPLSTVLWWRSVGHNHTGYVMETMMDQAARAAGEDPLAFRLKHLTGDAPDQRRMAGVLRAAAEAAGWDDPLPEGRARGIAAHKSFETYVAEVVEISQSDGRIQIERVVCAVDCGLAVNPDVVKAQMESGIGYGLGAVMRNAVTFEGGEVQQVNFPDYEPLRISDIKAIEVVIVPSAAAPTGVGEPAVPPAGPALANAIAALPGGRLVTVLPMAENGVTFA